MIKKGDQILLNIFLKFRDEKYFFITIYKMCCFIFVVFIRDFLPECYSTFVVSSDVLKDTRFFIPFSFWVLSSILLFFYDNVCSSSTFFSIFWNANTIFFNTHVFRIAYLHRSCFNSIILSIWFSIFFIFSDVFRSLSRSFTYYSCYFFSIKFRSMFSLTCFKVIFYLAIRRISLVPHSFIYVFNKNITM